MKKLRWGLIGCGDIVKKRVAAALIESESSELVAATRANVALLDEFANTFKIPKRYAHWQELIADPDIDAVYIATPVYLHAEQSIAAAIAGKHVLCEKPMAMNVSECDAMIAAATLHEVKLGVAYYRHFYPVVVRIKELLNNGKIGGVVVAQINAFEWFNPPESNPRAWLLKNKLSGGGPMMDFGCHRLEVMMNLFGAPKDVRSMSSRAKFEREVEDTAAVILEFETGTLGQVTVSHATREAQDTLTIFGSSGTIRVPVLNEGNLILSNAAGERKESHPPDKNLHRPLIDNFVDSVLNGHELQVSGVTGREVASIQEQIAARN